MESDRQPAGLVLGRQDHPTVGALDLDLELL